MSEDSISKSLRWAFLVIFCLVTIGLVTSTYKTHQMLTSLNELIADQREMIATVKLSVAQISKCMSFLEATRDPQRPPNRAIGLTHSLCLELFPLSAPH